MEEKVKKVALVRPRSVPKMVKFQFFWKNEKVAKTRKIEQDWTHGNASSSSFARDRTLNFFLHVT